MGLRRGIGVGSLRCTSHESDVSSLRSNGRDLGTSPGPSGTCLPPTVKPHMRYAGVSCLAS